MLFAYADPRRKSRQSLVPGPRRRKQVRRRELRARYERPRGKIVKVDPTIILPQVPIAVAQYNELTAWFDTEWEYRCQTFPETCTGDVQQTRQWLQGLASYTRCYWPEVTGTNNPLVISGTSTGSVYMGATTSTYNTLTLTLEDVVQQWWHNANVKLVMENTWREWQGDYYSDHNGNKLVLNERTQTWDVWNETQEEREARHRAEAQRRVEREEAQRRQAQEYQARLQQQAEQRKVANARAEALLRRHLTPEQEQAYFELGYFDLVVEGGDKPPRHYRIERSTHGNVKRLEARGGALVTVERICVQPDNVPTADANLAQLLHLRHDEAGFRRAANITRVG